MSDAADRDAAKQVCAVLFRFQGNSKTKQNPKYRTRTCQKTVIGMKLFFRTAWGGSQKVGVVLLGFWGNEKLGKNRSIKQECAIANDH